MEMQIWFLISNISLEKEMTTYSSILAWEIPWKEQPGGLQSMETQRCQIQLGDWTRVKLSNMLPYRRLFRICGAQSVLVCLQTFVLEMQISQLKLLKIASSNRWLKAIALICLTEFTFSGSKGFFIFVTVQSLLCLTLCDPMDCSMPCFPVLNCLLQFAQIHIH